MEEGNESLLSHKPLLNNKDIKAILSKVDLTKDDIYFIQAIQSLQNRNETYIQQLLNRIAISIAIDFKDKINLIFKQNDNGGYQSNAGRMRKKAEGTIAGASDCEVWIASKANPKIKEIMFFEVKKLASGYTISDNQIEFIDNMKASFGCDGYITNNPVFFRNKIIEKLKIMLDN